MTILAITILALILRLILANQSFWLDEAGLKRTGDYQFIGLGAVYEYQTP